MLHALNLGGRINEFRHPILVSDGSKTAPSLARSTAPSTGLFFNGSMLVMAEDTVGRFGVGAAGGSALMLLPASMPISWTDGSDIITAQRDLNLLRDAANVLAQQNGTNAQAFRLYNTFTDASNYERLSIGWSSNTIVIGTQWAGTGANRNMILDCSGLHLYLGGSRFYTFNTGGFVSGGASQDLGDGAGNDWRDLYLTRDFLHLGGNGQRARIKYATELTTIAASPDTDTAIQVPANAIILGVSVRVTVQPGGTSTLDIGISGDTTRYVTGMSSAATTTAVKARVDAYASATSIRITPNTTPSDAAGRVRVTIHYLDLVAPTS